MEAIFAKIIEMSFAASWLIVAVILLRLFLSKAPKGFRYVLWALVAIRLICPFSVESNLSLVPDTDGLLMEETPELGLGDDAGTGETDGNTGAGENNMVTTPGQGSTVQGTLPSVPNTTPSVPNTTPVVPGVTPSVPDNNTGVSDVAPVVPDAIQLADVLPLVWAVGAVLMLVYMVVSYVRLWNHVKISVPIDEKIYICDEIRSPFIFGVIRPSIYIPSHIEKDQLTYILAHEREHLRCMDHMWKPFGFMLLAVHWFNPLVWVAYILMCRDLELACDERVIRHMNSSEKRNYSETLLACSAPGHYISACPVAFGEIGIKERIKRVLSYKKPTVWIIGVAVLLCVVVGVCFMTDPSRAEGTNGPETESELESESESNSEIESETGSVEDSEPVDTPVSMEKVFYETTADLNHDGIDDLLRTIVYSEDYTFDLESGYDVAYIQVFAGVGDGSYEETPCYTSDYCGTSHSANGTYCLTEKDGIDYLMYSNMYEHQGEAHYEYCVFYLSGDSQANEIELENDYVTFATTPFWYSWNYLPKREEVVPRLQEKMNSWIRYGTILMSLDVETPVYYSTEGDVYPAFKYYDHIWARTDEAEIESFIEGNSSSPWQLFLYDSDLLDYVVQINYMLDFGVSEWFEEYNGETLQRIGEDGPEDITVAEDLIYYKAEDGEDAQSVIKKMIEAMIIPRMEESDLRSYTITKYALADMPIIQVSENIWLIEYLYGYYAYDGEIMEWTFEDRLEHVGEESVDGLVPFDLEGDTSELLYMLIEGNGVYRLEKYSGIYYDYINGN